MRRSTLTQDFKGLSYTKLTAHQEEATTALALHPNSVQQFTQYSQSKDSQCYNLVNFKLGMDFLYGKNISFFLYFVF